MISLRKFLSNAETDQALVHVVRLLTESLNQYAGVDDSEDCARFRQTTQEFLDGLVEGTSEPELLVRAGAVVKGFEEYNHRARKHQRMQNAELLNMVKMLTSTMKAVTATSNSSLNVLGDIEQRITTVSELEDVRVIKARLGDCLAEIRKEAQRQQKQAAETIDELNRGLDQARKRAAGIESESRDEITGLPQRSEAEAAISHAGQTGERAFAAVLVLDRLQILNARFGREVGDEILSAFTRMVRRQLAPGDRLFRWAGAALLALLPRPASIDAVRMELARVMATKLEHIIQTPSRSLMVPISARWTLFPIMAATRLTCQKIDTFAAAPALHD